VALRLERLGQPVFIRHFLGVHCHICPVSSVNFMTRRHCPM
jgi:hypothetical protein